MIVVVVVVGGGGGVVVECCCFLIKIIVVVRWPRLSQTVAEVDRFSKESFVSSAYAAHRTIESFVVVTRFLDNWRATFAAILRTCCMVPSTVSAIIATFEIYHSKNRAKIVGRGQSVALSIAFFVDRFKSLQKSYQNWSCAAPFQFGGLLVI